MIKSWLFLCFVKVFCKLLAKGIANKTIHDIIHARREAVALHCNEWLGAW